MPENISLDRWKAQREIELDHSMLSPSGRVSERARRAAQNRNQERLDHNRRVVEAWYDAVDAGEIVDPEGHYTAGQREREAAEDRRQGRITVLRSEARRWQDFLNQGYRPRVSKRELARCKAELAELGVTL